MLTDFIHAFALQDAVLEEKARDLQRLLSRVQQLETASWNRPDAVEDLGHINCRCCGNNLESVSGRMECRR